MSTEILKIVGVTALCLLFLSSCMTTKAQTEDLGDGFSDHGVATPISNSRGLVSTVDGEGNNVVLVWLMDHRGSYAILMIDTQTGETRQFPTPWDMTHDSPFASLLSSDNKYYTHFNNHFCEFDPTKPGFTFWEKTKPRVAMGMTESDDGLIYAVTYPNSGVVQYNPDTGEMTDFGYVYDQNWAMYQRDVACDDTGWLYFGVGNTKAQIIAFDPTTEEATPMFDDDVRPKGRGVLYRDEDGKVYGNLQGGDWYQFYQGQKTLVGEEVEKRDPKQIITGHQGLFWRNFPDGTRLAKCSLLDRTLVTEAPETGEKHEVEFDYESEGAHLMGVNIAPNDTVCGGTAFPMRFFSYNPDSDEWTNRPAFGQFNTVATRGDHWYVGGYTGGWLLEWDPSREWVNTKKGNEESNPQFLAQAKPTINRPHDLLPYPDGKTVILGGTPGYGYTGGGLLLWNRETEEATLLEHTDLVEWQAPMSLLDLPDGKVLVGMTVSPGTGGERKADVADILILDLHSTEIQWRAKLFENASSYYDLCHGPDGLVYGLIGTTTFFVLNPETKEIVHTKSLEEDYGRTTGQQGPRVFVTDDEGTVYMLFRSGIARVNPEDHSIEWLADSPIGIGPGGDYLDGKIYFGSGSHLYSWEITDTDETN